MRHLQRLGVVALVTPFLLQGLIFSGFVDCNGNGIDDTVEINHGTALDCNGNGVPDECDIDDQTSVDCDADGVPDECGDDCNGNGIADSCDLTSETSPDCNTNGIPDECDTEIAFVETVIDSVYAPVAIASDIDGDGDPDVVAALAQAVAWYENLGPGSFGPQQPIGVTAGDARALLVADLDGDGDQDVLHGTWGTFSIAWHENLDGQGTFGPSRMIEDLGVPGADASALTVLAADLDGDQDLDVVSSIVGIAGPYTVGWNENTDGAGTFGTLQTIWSGSEPRRGVAADVDDDGDTDLVFAYYNDVAWFENLDGAGAFSPPNFFANDGSLDAFAADVDGDGDVDALANDDDALNLPGEGSFGWFENLDGAGAFGPLQSFVDHLVIDVDFVDLDYDGDHEIVEASDEAPWGIAWRENIDGTGPFGPPQTISDARAWSVAALDMDDDVDPDLLVGIVGEGSRLVLLENTSDDCNANGTPDSCDIGSGTSQDCNADGVPDECEQDCNANDVPDECETSCTTDCDVDVDDCADELDCDPTDGGVWSDPGPIDSLALKLDGNVITLSWQLPAHPGAASVVYDTLRSFAVSDFHGPAVCLDSDAVDTVTDDTDATASLDDFFYLIRVENACPGGTGSMGSGSDGLPRSGVNCP